jgi:hypothetical protein
MKMNFFSIEKKHIKKFYLPHVCDLGSNNDPSLHLHTLYPELKSK